MCSTSNLRLYNSTLQQETYGKQSRHNPKVVYEQGLIKQRFERRKNPVFTVCHCSFSPQEVKLGPTSMANFSKTAQQKNTLSTVCSTARDTHYITKWAQSAHSSRSYSKIKVPYHMTPVERYSTFRAKTDLLNYIKRHVKYIWEQFPLSGKSNGLFKTHFYNTVQRCRWCQSDGVNRFWW